MVAADEVVPPSRACLCSLFLTAYQFDLFGLPFNWSAPIDREIRPKALQPRYGVGRDGLVAPYDDLLQRRHFS